MANCSFVNEEESGTVNGWYCNVKGEFVEYSLYTNYCNSQVNCEHCPYLGGDDRFRNQDALIEEICQSICNSVRENLWKTMNEVQGFLNKLYELANYTNYEYLCVYIKKAAACDIPTPSVSSQYVQAVKTNIEKDRARQLELDIYNIFKDFQPKEHIFQVGIDSSQIEIGYKVFEQIFRLIENYRSIIVETIADGEIDANGISKYEEPAKRAQEELGNEIDEYLKGIQSSIEKVQYFFERECSTVFHHIGKVNQNPPKVPEWRYEN